MKKFNFRDFLNKLYQNHALVYKIALFAVTTLAIVYMFPKGGHFKYEFHNGKPWQYDNLYAPFDFAIHKSEQKIEEEKRTITSNKKLYFSYKEDVITKVKSELEKNISKNAQDSILDNYNAKRIVNFLNGLIDDIYKEGYINQNDVNRVEDKQLVALRKGNTISDIVFDHFLTSNEVDTLIKNHFNRSRYESLEAYLTPVVLKILEPNIFYDEELTDKILQDQLNKISYTEGLVTENERIISKGDVVEGKKLRILNSLEKEYLSQVWNQSNYNWIVFGYVLLVALNLLMLLLFLQKYRPFIFENNTKVTFIFFNIFLMVLIVTLVVKYRVDYLYVVPLPILPIIIKAFFDARLGLFTHVLTVLLLGFIVPNSFEFIFLQIIAGIITILTVSELHRRANLFISISQITLVYMVAYFAFSIIQEGNMLKINWQYFILFALNGVLSFLSLFLILVYEKTFGLVSDVSLLEMSNTNSKLLRELAEKAPGTFQHSMQVANLAEASANEIGANAMLVRTGALYHDIGKMLNPKYFTENQTTSVNPHNELTPKDSAEIIINHVIDGIEIAKKHRLPDRIIDFIRTHHGTSLVYYFYKQQEKENPEDLNIEDFSYGGPIPFSKETAILMMCDAAEAASKSLKEPTAQLIDELIEKIVASQMANGQFMNADITFKEIQIIKKVIKKKLNNIYHLRIEYPE
ncbi:HDIG domain-containing protein [Aureibaculum sp. 2210JD6-5]|uniref:HD family phosphohydrolase n=1 Tax=Aureibaculum sp. 2210JD6-5 TaxID=3103957 RepID=UPI002AAE098B|nr:HDIG domain-containing metalloprotein [Aureibaculum sp. 2210JD6-5]MDY7396624.1 HDIG domain-containing protein [Aureibaculum sp. 2210JD6-5]